MRSRLTKVVWGAAFCLGLGVTTCAEHRPAAAPEQVELGGAGAPVQVVALAGTSSPGSFAATPGKIRCESVECDLATEVCCIAAPHVGPREGRCVAKPPPGARAGEACCPNAGIYCGNEHMTIERTCDEAADCPGKQRCCAGNAGEGDLAYEECGSKCGEEVCVADSTCKNGNRCDADGGASSGRCPLQIAPPTCGAESCKEAEACCWDPETRRGRCGAECNLEIEIAYRCIAPDQCAPYDCNMFPGAREYRCGGAFFIASVLCDTPSDCPEQLSSTGYGPHAPKLTGCTHTSGLPDGVKSCDYD